MRISVVQLSVSSVSIVAFDDLFFVVIDDVVGDLVDHFVDSFFDYFGLHLHGVGFVLFLRGRYRRRSTDAITSPRFSRFMTRTPCAVSAYDADVGHSYAECDARKVDDHEIIVVVDAFDGNESARFSA